MSGTFFAPSAAFPYAGKSAFYSKKTKSGPYGLSRSGFCLRLFLLLRNKNIDPDGLALAAIAATGRLAKKIASVSLRLFFIYRYIVSRFFSKLLTKGNTFDIIMSTKPVSFRLERRFRHAAAVSKAPAA
ncbi:MAG: hypothetical protein Q4G07_04870 [Oscillospiraceae bacterium]|nr:hypothetical protein [Oscillospiraceae bacterium]